MILIKNFKINKDLHTQMSISVQPNFKKLNYLVSLSSRFFLAPGQVVLLLMSIPIRIIISKKIAAKMKNNFLDFFIYVMRSLYLQKDLIHLP